MTNNANHLLLNCGVRAIEHTFFLSHVQENVDDLKELKREITLQSRKRGRKSLDCFLDNEDWQIGRLDGNVLREKLIVSEIFVAWITPEYLMNRRGWIWMEMAYAELIELSLNVGQLGNTLEYVISIYRGWGQGLDLNELLRSPWGNYLSQGIGRNPTEQLTIQNIAKILVKFHCAQMKRKMSPG